MPPRDFASGRNPCGGNNNNNSNNNNNNNNNNFILKNQSVHTEITITIMKIIFTMKNKNSSVDYLQI